MRIYSDARRVAAIYLLCSLVISAWMMVTQPPMNPGHENQYFLYGLTYSTLYRDGTLPESLVRFNGSATRAHSLYARMFRQDGMTDVMSRLNAKEKWRGLNKEKRVLFPPFNNVARYPFTAYIPHMIAGTMGDVLDLPPVEIYYLVRFLCIVPAVLVGYVTLRLLPAFHIQALAFLLLPSIWKLRACQYPDNVLNISAMIYVMLLLRLVCLRVPLTWRMLAMLTGTGIVLSITKLVYFPLALTIAFVPAGCFRSTRHRIFCVAVVIGFSALATGINLAGAYQRNYAVSMVGLSAAAVSGETLQTEEKPETAVSRAPSPQKGRGENVDSSPQQAAYIRLLRDPSHAFLRIAKAYTSPRFWERIVTWMFLWNERYPYWLKPYALLLSLVALLPYVCAFVPREKLRGWPGPGSRAGIAALIILTALLIALGIHLNAPWANLERRGILGRYFLPLLPFLLLACALPVGNRWRKTCMRLTFFTAFAPIVILYFSLMS